MCLAIMDLTDSHWKKYYLHSLQEKGISVTKKSVVKNKKSVMENTKLMVQNLVRLKKLVAPVTRLSQLNF